jgi:hypothetical protein
VNTPIYWSRYDQGVTTTWTSDEVPDNAVQLQIGKKVRLINYDKGIYLGDDGDTHRIPNLTYHVSSAEPDCLVLRDRAKDTVIRIKGREVE